MHSYPYPYNAFVTEILDEQEFVKIIKGQLAEIAPEQLSAAKTHLVAMHQNYGLSDQAMESCLQALQAQIRENERLAEQQKTEEASALPNEHHSEVNQVQKDTVEQSLENDKTMIAPALVARNGTGKPSKIDHHYPQVEYKNKQVQHTNIKPADATSATCIIDNESTASPLNYQQGSQNKAALEERPQPIAMENSDETVIYQPPAVKKQPTSRVDDIEETKINYIGEQTSREIPAGTIEEDSKRSLQKGSSSTAHTDVLNDQFKHVETKNNPLPSSKLSLLVVFAGITAGLFIFNTTLKLTSSENEIGQLENERVKTPNEVTEHKADVENTTLAVEDIEQPKPLKQAENGFTFNDSLTKQVEPTLAERSISSQTPSEIADTDNKAVEAGKVDLNNIGVLSPEEDSTKNLTEQQDKDLANEPIVPQSDEIETSEQPATVVSIDNQIATPEDDIAIEKDEAKPQTLIDSTAAVQSATSITTPTSEPEAVLKPYLEDVLPFNPTDTEVLFRELVDLAQDLKIEPSSDPDTALNRLDQLMNIDPHYPGLDQAYHYISRGYLALSKLAYAEQNRVKSDYLLGESIKFQTMAQKVRKEKAKAQNP